MCVSGAASVGSHASDWSLAIHSNAFGWLLAWLLVYLFNVLVHQVRGSWKSRSWESQTAFSNQPDKRLVACYTFCIRKSRSLVQLNVPYILAGFYQRTCNCFWFLSVFLCLFNSLPDAKIMLMFPC